MKDVSTHDTIGFMQSVKTPQFKNRRPDSRVIGGTLELPFSTHAEALAYRRAIDDMHALVCRLAEFEFTAGDCDFGGLSNLIDAAQAIVGEP